MSKQAKKCLFQGQEKLGKYYKEYYREMSNPDIDKRKVFRKEMEHEYKKRVNRATYNKC